MGFRAFVLRLAREYHLKGEVWNSSDGSVGAVLQSDNSGNLERALQKLRGGPGEVESIDSQDLLEAPVFDGFSVTTTVRD